MNLDPFRLWTGNIEDFASKAAIVLREIGRHEVNEPSIRLIRDYLQRGLLGEPKKRGREAVFRYEQLLRFVAIRTLLADGWPLSKIAEHFAASPPAEIESLVSSTSALDGAERSLPSGEPDTPSFHKRAARMTSMQSELRDALGLLGLPDDPYPTEEVTVIALAPWFQMLVQSSRLRRITLEEAEELGRAVTASLLNATTRKGNKK